MPSVVVRQRLLFSSASFWIFLCFRQSWTGRIRNNCWGMCTEHQEQGTSLCTLQRKFEHIPVDGGLTLQWLYVSMDKEMPEPEYKVLCTKICRPQIETLLLLFFPLHSWNCWINISLKIGLFYFDKSQLYCNYLLPVILLLCYFSTTFNVLHTG